MAVQEHWLLHGGGFLGCVLKVEKPDILVRVKIFQIRFSNFAGISWDLRNSRDLPAFGLKRK